MPTIPCHHVVADNWLSGRCSYKRRFSQQWTRRWASTKMVTVIATFVFQYYLFITARVARVYRFCLVCVCVCVCPSICLSRPGCLSGAYCLSPTITPHTIPPSPRLPIPPCYCGRWIGSLMRSTTWIWTIWDSDRQSDRLWLYCLLLSEQLA